MQGIIGFREFNINSYKSLTSNRVTTFLPATNLWLLVVSLKTPCTNIQEWTAGDDLPGYSDLCQHLTKRTWLNENWVESRILVLGHRKVPPTSWGSSGDLHHQYYVLWFLDACKSRSRCHLQRFCHQKNGSHQIQLQGGIAGSRFCPIQMEKRQKRFDHLWKRSDSSLQTPPSSSVPLSCGCCLLNQISQTRFVLPAAISANRR